MFEIFVQAIGFVAVILAFFIFVQKKRKNLLFFKLITDFLWMAHFGLMCAYTPMLVTFVAVFREFIFLKRDEVKVLKSKIIPIIFSFIYLFVAVFSWNGIKSLLSVTASTLATFAFYESKVNKIRVISFIVSCIMMINGIAYGSLANIVNEIITIISIFIGFWKGRNNREKIV